jgi:hypothetical protein
VETEAAGDVAIATARADQRGAAASAEGSFERPIGKTAVVLVALALVLGTFMRLWFVFHQPLTADEAIDGLMAHQILHGHLAAFYWGQSYGGVEPYLTAVLYAALGQSRWVVPLTPLLLSALSSVLMWRVARRLVADRGLALLAGALLWCFSEVVIWNSTIAWGFRGVTMACGLGLILLALRLLDGGPSWADAAGVGLVTGLGWWSSPEFVFFLVPAAVLLAVGIWRRRQGSSPSWPAAAAVAVGCFVIGAAPWLWNNAHSRLGSLRSRSFEVPPGTSYRGNLSAFAHHVAFLEVGLQRRLNGTWSFGNGHDVLTRGVMVLLGVALVASVVASLVACALRDAKGRAFAIGIVGFPLLYAASPATWFWLDGRYGVYAAPLLVGALTIGAGELSRFGAMAGRWNRAAARAPRAALGAWLAVAMALALAGFHQVNGVTPTSAFKGWSDPDAPGRAIAHTLMSGGVRTGYADYWIAYKLDLLGGGPLRLTTAGTDTDRSQAYDAATRASRQAAWLFVPAAGMPEAIVQFGGTTYLAGPDGLPERQFLATLATLHIGYRVVHAGPIEAVIPDRPVTPAQAGLPARSAPAG